MALPISQVLATQSYFTVTEKGTKFYNIFKKKKSLELLPETRQELEVSEKSATFPSPPGSFPELKMLADLHFLRITVDNRWVANPGENRFKPPRL